MNYLPKSWLTAFLAVSISFSGLIEQSAQAQFSEFQAPAGTLPTRRNYPINGLKGAILPNGRFITPLGTEANVDAPKPFGMVLSPDGDTLITTNSGSAPFSVTLIRGIKSTAQPVIKRIDLNATYLGVAFAPDGSRFYVSGGENGNIWVGDTALGQIIGSVNLNGAAQPLTAPLDVVADSSAFKGTYPGKLVVSRNGKYVYVTDQAGCQVFVIDTTQIVTGVDSSSKLTEPNNFAAVISSAKVGRYPFGIALSSDNKTLLVTNVGTFQYTHLTPATVTGDSNQDYPLCYPGVGYPEETAQDTTIRIKKVDPRNLPTSLRDPQGIRCGYIPQTQNYTIPGLGSPNAPAASSVYALDVSNPSQPTLQKIAKTGPLVGEIEQGISTYSGSHPNSVIANQKAIFVANGNNDSISILDAKTFREVSRVNLSLFKGSPIKGVQPVGLALSPDNQFLYVAEAGINAIAVIQLKDQNATVIGHIPTGWWPSSVQVSSDGKTLYVANAHGRGAGPNNVFPPNNLGSAKYSVLGTVNYFEVPTAKQLTQYTNQVLTNNGFTTKTTLVSADNPLPIKFGKASEQIKHIIFINKENSTYDQLLGDIQQTRTGTPVEGEPRYSLGYSASPNHHQLALDFAFGDNFYLEPAVSSDGHRWLTNTYLTEFEEAHWPASYGGKRNDAGDDPEVYEPYPGRLGFTDANGSPDPQDYNQHGGIYLHLARNNRSFVNFGNGFEFAQVDESGDTEPTGIRQHVNVPMEKVVRDNSDHLYPEYNTHIPDAPQEADPTRFNRYGRFKQVFEAKYVDRANGVCNLPNYVDLYYPNDHGGGANDINPTGQTWSFKRFIQDNDAALGYTVDLISHSPCWKDTVIFVVEDDTQNGYDHVDGYRSIFLAISPWIKHEYVSKTHLSLASIFKTVNLLLGIPALNQYDAAATDLRDLFTKTPDFRPYTFTPVNYDQAASAAWIQLSKEINFQAPDADELKLREAILKSEGLPRELPHKTGKP